MSAWWITFGFGWVAGGITVAAWFGAKLVDRDRRMFDEGRLAQRDGIAQRRPVGDVPDWRSRTHPACRRDRGVSDVTAAFGGLLMAAVVLLAAGGVW